MAGDARQTDRCQSGFNLTSLWFSHIILFASHSSPLFAPCQDMFALLFSWPSPVPQQVAFLPYWTLLVSTSYFHVYFLTITCWLWDTPGGYFTSVLFSAKLHLDYKSLRPIQKLSGFSSVSSQSMQIFLQSSITAFCISYLLN